MPNWCVNQLHISGPDSDEIVDFMTEPKPLLHRQATRAAVKLFLAGVGGLLKPTTAMRFDLYPDLVRDVGADIAENRVFTRFVTLLESAPVLTDEVCQRLIELFEQSGLKQRYWGDLPKPARMKISPLLKNSAFDWCSAYFRRIALDIAWTKLDVPTVGALSPDCFSLDALLPPKLLVEINGFNGHLFPSSAKVPSGHRDNCERLGTKWEMVQVVELGEGKLEFDTAWSPALPPIAELARRYPNSTITHYFSESGCAFCGYVRYENGEQVEEVWEDMQISDEPNEHGYHDLIGPTYITEHFNRYGG